MPFDRPTLQVIIDRIISDIKNRISGAATFLRRSVFYVFAKVYGASIHLLYEFIEYWKDQIFATTADTKYLEQLGSEVGVTRNIGVKATGSGQATGTNGTAIPAGSELQSATGNVYETSAAATIAGGIATLSFIANDYGSDWNEAAGVELTFVSPISGVQTVVTVDSSGITGGVDSETDTAYRNRVLERKRQPPHGGADFDYVAWAKQVSGVTRAWAIPLYQGIGTIGLAFVRDNDDDIIPDSTERAAVESYIQSHTDPVTGKTVGLPVTADPGFFVIEVSKKTINFTIKISPNTAAVQASVTSQLTDLMFNDGGPEQEITISQMYEAIMGATGITKSEIVIPSTSQTASTQEVHVLGDVTYQDY